VVLYQHLGPGKGGEQKFPTTKTTKRLFFCGGGFENKGSEDTVGCGGEEKGKTKARKKTFFSKIVRERRKREPTRGVPTREKKRKKGTEEKAGT